MKWSAIEHINSLARQVKARDTFARNLALTFSGNAVATLVGFCFTPFIARIYGPTAYGIFAFFGAVTSTLSPISTLRFPSAYVVADNDNEFYDLVRVTIITLLAGTGLVTFSVFAMDESLLDYFGKVEVSQYLYFVPLYFFFMGANHLFLGWNIRLKEFGRGAATKVISVVISKGFTLAGGLAFTPSAFFIILGNLLLYPLEAGLKAPSRLRRELVALLRTTPGNLRATFSKFRAYPLFVTPGLLMNNFALQLPVYFVSLGFATAYVGHFSLATNLVTMPLSIATNSTTTVFLQKAAELHKNGTPLGSYVRRLYKRLFLLALIPLTVLAFISEWVFVVIFGEDWRPAGVVASVLALSAVFSLPWNPLSVLFRVMFKERINFVLNVGQLVLKAIALWIGVVVLGDFYITVALFGFVTILGYVMSLYAIFRLTGLSLSILLRDSAVVMAIFALILFFKLY